MRKNWKKTKKKRCKICGNLTYSGAYCEDCQRLRRTGGYRL